jgi:hypothetical protein
MTSVQKIAANRLNSNKSTGPRTRRGEAHVRHSALRHGLSAVTVFDPAISIQVDHLATAICGERADPAMREHALIIAESEQTLSKIRVLRSALLEQIAPERSFTPTAETIRCCLARLRALDRYERRAFARRKRGFVSLRKLRSTNSCSWRVSAEQSQKYQ